MAADTPSCRRPAAADLNVRLVGIWVDEQLTEALADESAGVSRRPATSTPSSASSPRTTCCRSRSRPGSARGALDRAAQTAAAAAAGWRCSSVPDGTPEEQGQALSTALAQTGCRARGVGQPALRHLRRDDRPGRWRGRTTGCRSPEPIPSPCSGAGSRSYRPRADARRRTTGPARDVPPGGAGAAHPGGVAAARRGDAGPRGSPRTIRWRRGAGRRRRRGRAAVGDGAGRGRPELLARAAGGTVVWLVGDDGDVGSDGGLGPAARRRRRRRGGA